MKAIADASRQRRFDGDAMEWKGRARGSRAVPEYLIGHERGAAKAVARTVVIHAWACILLLGIVCPLQARFHVALDSANRWVK